MPACRPVCVLFLTLTLAIDCFASAFVMRTFAQMPQDHDAKINFSSDWTFSRGVALYEPTLYGGLEAMGYEIDAHAHESSVL